jgi:hypothetical protein
MYLPIGINASFNALSPNATSGKIGFDKLKTLESTTLISTLSLIFLQNYKRRQTQQNHFLI